MKITEVRVKLLGGRSDRLRAFCSITLDDQFVVHDLRVIDGRKGLFVAMPSRKLSDSCSRCGGKNHLRAKYCSECGGKLDENRALKGAKARDKFHVDVAHPILPACREVVQTTVLTAYEEEATRAADGRELDRTYDRDEDYEELVADEGAAPDAERHEERIAAEEEEEYDVGASSDPEASEGIREDEPPPAPPESEDEEEEEEEEEHPRPGEKPGKREGSGGFGQGIF